MRYPLRALLILLAVVPPRFWLGWSRYQAWTAEQDRRAAIKEVFAPLPSVVGTVRMDDDGYGDDANGKVIFRLDPSPPPDSTKL